MYLTISHCIRKILEAIPYNSTKANTVESPNKGHFVDNMNSDELLDVFLFILGL